jgi:hypothetical protein
MRDDPPDRVWTDERLVVQRSPIEGDGLFASEAIAEGTVVVRLGGRTVSSAVLADMIDAADRDVDAPYVDAITVFDDAHVVLPPLSRAHFGNHSCDPNVWPVGPYELAARRPIPAGEEITLDYAAVSGADGLAMTCDCGSVTCRGRVTGDDWRRPDLQRRYDGHWTPALRQRIETARQADSRSPGTQPEPSRCQSREGRIS